MFPDHPSHQPAQAKLWRKNSRAINNSLAFASTQVKEVDFKVGGQGVPQFRMHGSVIHNVGPLEASPNHPPSFAQVYFHSTAEERSALRLDKAHLGGGSAAQGAERRALLTGLEQMIEEFHPFHREATTFLERARAAMETGEPLPPEAKLLFLDRDGQIRPPHSGAYNPVSASDEIAAVVPELEDVDNRQAPRQFAVHLRAPDGAPPLQQFPMVHALTDPLSYPVLFPHGTPGWHINIPYVNDPPIQRRFITAMEFYRSQLQIRDPVGVIHSDIVHHGCRLFQQYVCDQFCKVEDSRLNWVRHHQREIRADVYQGVTDALHDDALREGGTKVVLPSSHSGSPRYLQQRTQDALAIVREIPGPHLFITMTTNPNWAEIQAALLPGHTAQDRCDITCRVFRMKKDALIADLYAHGVKGQAVAHIHVVEFQKRGLPHLHLTIFLANPPDVDLIDKMTCAEIPDPVRFPRLHAIVTTCMFHSCSAKCASSESGLCSKHYPKEFRRTTSYDEETDDRVQYRRRSPSDGGRTFLRPAGAGKQAEQFDNSRVVPYSPYLSLRYNCHINVEIATNSKCVKYLFKYLHKGSDRTAFKVGAVDDAVDEISDYQDARYISACEAFWRLMDFEIFGQSHRVTRLDVHLPGQQYVQHDTSVAGATAALLGAESTTLTDYFRTVLYERNAPLIAAELRGGPPACALLYHDFPKWYSWKKGEGWKRRSKTAHRGIYLGRMYAAAPYQQERYFLRLLLTSVTNSASYEELRTFDSVLHPSFRSACLARGLIADDDEWRMCLAQASATCGAGTLRQLFATILLHCSPSVVQPLWEGFADHMSADFTYARRCPVSGDVPLQATADDHHSALRSLEVLLKRGGRCLQHFGLPIPPDAPAPSPPHASHASLLSAAFLGDEERERASRFAHEGTATLNTDQRTFYTAVTAAIDSVVAEQPCPVGGHVFFLEAPGGTGKTHVLSLLLAAVRSRRRVALAAASSGIAATLLPRAETIHRCYGVPVPCNGQSTSAIKGRSERAELHANAVLKVLDEALMSSRHVFNVCEEISRECAPSSGASFISGPPFGGAVVVLSGDPRQILPVVQRGNRGSIVEASLHRSSFWKHVQRFSFTINERIRQRISASGPDQCRDAAAYAAWLLQLGEGSVTNTALPDLARFDDLILIPASLLHSTQTLSALADEFVYATMAANFRDPEYFADRCILTPYNRDVDLINDRQLERLPDPDNSVREFLSADRVGPMDNAGLWPQELLHQLLPSGLPPHKLKLKTHAVIILLRSLDVEEGLCNGTRLVVTALSTCLITARVVTKGAHFGKICFIPRVELTPSQTDLPFELTRRQFPVRLAFALTINKSQGQTIPTVGLFLPRPVFSHGQLYVGLSRVGDPADVRVVILPVPGTQGSSTHLPGVFTRNVVYREIFPHLRSTFPTAGPDPPRIDPPAAPSRPPSPPPSLLPPAPLLFLPPAPLHYGDRFAATASWLFVPLIRAALALEPLQHVYAAEAFVPPWLWRGAVSLFAADFSARGVVAVDLPFMADGYIAAQFQEFLLYPVSILPGQSTVPANHIIRSQLDVVASIARTPAISHANIRDTADAVIANHLAHAYGCICAQCL